MHDGSHSFYFDESTRYTTHQHSTVRRLSTATLNCNVSVIKKTLEDKSVLTYVMQEDIVISQASESVFHFVCLVN